MASDLNLKISVDDQASGKIKNLMESLNSQPVGARNAIKDLDKDLGNILSTLKSFSGLSSVSTVFQQAFGQVSAQAVKNFKQDLKLLQTELGQTELSVKGLLTGLSNAVQAGNVKAAEATRSLIVSKLGVAAGLKGQIDLQQGAIDKVTGAVRIEDIAGEIKNSVLGALGLGRLAGGFGTAAGIVAGAGILGYSTLRGIESGQARADIASRVFRQAAATEAIYGNDPTRAVLQQSGLDAGPAGFNFAQRGFRTFAGVRSFLTEGSYQAGADRYAKEQSDLALDQNANVRRFTEFRNRLAADNPLAEDILGQAALSRVYSGLNENGVDRASAAPYVEALARQGQRGVNAANAVDATFLRRSGVNAAFADVIARNNANGTDPQVIQFLTQAGLGNKFSKPSRNAITAALLENAAVLGDTTVSNVAEYGRGLSGAVSTAVAGGARIGIAPNDATQIGIEAFKREQTALRTAYDPRRIAVQGYLSNQGLTQAQIQVVLQNLSDDSRIQAAAKTASRNLGHRVTAAEIRRGIQGATGEAEQGLTNIVGSQLGTEFSGFGDSLITGVADRQKARLLRSAQRRATGVTGGTGREAFEVGAADTVAEQAVRQNAKIEQTITQAFSTFSSAVVKALNVQGSSLADDMHAVAVHFTDAARSGKNLKKKAYLGPYDEDE